MSYTDMDIEMKALSMLGSNVPGVTNNSKYRLITDTEGIAEGDCVTAAGRSYIVLRVEPVRIFGAFSHNECILKLKGGGTNA